MSGLVVFIILAIVIIGVVVGKKSYDNTKRLAEEGKISPRKGAFYENKEIFETAASYEQIRQKVKETNLEDTKANVQYDFEGGNAIFFQFSDAWNAIHIRTMRRKKWKESVSVLFSCMENQSKRDCKCDVNECAYYSDRENHLIH